MSLAAMAALSSVPLTYVVVRFEPFQRTTDVVVKPLPITLRLKAAPPAGLEAGSSRVMEGTGFPETTENETALDVPPPGAGLKTVTLAVPTAATSAAAIAADT
jgi:hypothetical protein